MNEKNKKEFIKLLKAGSQLFRPVAKCDCCQTIVYVDELQLLPDVEAYIRQFASSQLHGGEDELEPLNDEKLKARYGYGSQNLFCRDCLQRLVENASDRCAE